MQPLKLILGLLLCAVPVRAMAIEATPIPRDPRPNFAPLLYTIGMWNCSVKSSRRARSFATRAVTRISEDGYWMVSVTTTPAVPWNPITLVARDYITYDSTRKLWVDLSMDNYGLYGASTSTGDTGDGFVWKDDLYPTWHATAIHFPRTVRKIGAQSMETTQRFGEPSGRTFLVKTACRKS